MFICIIMRDEVVRMRLYRMELYKLCYRKIFIVGAACVTGILLLFFWMKMSEEWAYVDGVVYEGYQAVKVNRKITKEFEGILTDEKVDAIIEKYGFPEEVRENYWGFYDSNFLNGFVVDYLSDGYLYDWDNYKAATQTYPIAETELGKAAELTGRKIVLEYSNGWFTFLEVLEIGMILGSILLIFGISTIFAREQQTKMLQLLFTSCEGRKKDIYVKIAAAFTVAVGIWLAIVILDFLLCGVVFGLDGQNCFIGATKIMRNIRAVKGLPDLMTVKYFIVVTLLRSLVGILLLCSTTICISACCRSSFHAVAGSAICWGMPLLIWIFLSFMGRNILFRIIRSLILLMVYSSSLYLSMYEAFYDLYRSRWVCWLPLPIAVMVSIVCTIAAYRKYRGQQVV